MHSSGTEWERGTDGRGLPAGFGYHGFNDAALGRFPNENVDAISAVNLATNGNGDARLLLAAGGRLFGRSFLLGFLQALKNVRFFATGTQDQGNKQSAKEKSYGWDSSL